MSSRLRRATAESIAQLRGLADDLIALSILRNQLPLLNHQYGRSDPKSGDFGYGRSAPNLANSASEGPKSGDFGYGTIDFGYGRHPAD